MEWYSLIAPATLTYKGARWSYRTLAQKFKVWRAKRLEYNRQRQRFERERELERQRLPRRSPSASGTGRLVLGDD